MYFLALAAGLVSLVCWIMVLIKMFPAEGALKGVLAIICGLYAFIWGWMNAGRFGLRNIMLIWTVAIIISVVANMMSGGMAMMQNMPQ
ncbi:MAG TPA: hypothetical protein VJ725_07605 [Thermoanaerobaculia bacterium]|nr:hypothetical protein [Thermoanaerobaculia bacterium]